MNKNTEMTVVNNYTALRDFNLAEAMASELSGMNISFDRVSVPAAGGLAFELPGELPGETDMAKEFTGVILFHHPLFTYYRDSFTGGNNLPDCGSYDGVYGVGDPGGRCDKCPLNQFGSDPNGGKACKNKRRVYILREGELIPILLTLPVGSMKEFAVYIKRLLTKGKKSSGEESPGEPSIRERAMELLFSKRDLKEAAARASFAQIRERHDDLLALGRALLDTALTLNEKIVAAWHKEALVVFSKLFDSRVVNNLACCMVGIHVLESMCARCGLTWGQVFGIGMDACVEHMEYGVREYLLDGGYANRSVVERTLENINRMGLSDEECRYLDGGKVAIHFRGIYDRYTRYRRECDLRGECLTYEEFMKQLKKSDLYLETKVVRFGDTTKKAAVLDDKALRERCDIESFLQAQGEPL